LVLADCCRRAGLLPERGRGDVRDRTRVEEEDRQSEQPGRADRGGLPRFADTLFRSDLLPLGPRPLLHRRGAVAGQGTLIRRSVCWLVEDRAPAGQLARHRSNRMRPSVFALAAVRLLAAAAPAQEWAKARLEKSPRHGEWVKVKQGKRQVQSFIVYPEVKHKATAVVVIHEIFGLTDWVRGVADQLA